MNTLNICWHWETVAIPITIWELIYIIFNKSNVVERFDSFVYFLYRLQANSYRVFHFCGIIYAYRIKYRTYHTPLVDAKLLLGLFTSYSNICPGNSSSFELVLRLYLWFHMHTCHEGAYAFLSTVPWPLPIPCWSIKAVYYVLPFYRSNIYRILK